MDKNVFISYGHGEYDFIVRKLADDLRSFGFQVFLDVDYLHVGNWEKIIDDHIVASKYFIFMVSKRSTSVEGYCLNELCRAGENNSTIIPIKLDESRVPLSINKLQRISLIECITPENQIIESRYKEVLLSVSSILSGKTNLGFSNDDIRLQSLLKPVSSSDFAFRYYSTFCGRKNAFESFERFVNSSRNFFWVLAGPGCGKTAFSSMLLWRYPEYVNAVHFCKFNNSDRANPKYIISSIAYQLANVIPEYKSKLVALMELETLFEKNASRIFEYLLVEPTQDIKVNKPVVIVIDALDECSWRGDNEICALLQRMKDRIPSWMKFVLTSRNQADIRRYLATFAQTYELSSSETEEDLREYYKRQLPDAPNDKIEILLTKSEGSFLYASEIVKQIKDENLQVMDINRFPVGITGFFNDCFLRLFSKESGSEISFESVIPILEFLCISQEPVDVSFLEEYLQFDEYQLKKLLAHISGLFPIKSNFIEPLHKSLIDWLTDSEDISKIFYVSTKSAYNKLLKYIEQKYSAQKYDDLYVMKYFGSTLISLSNYDRLYEILDDYALQKTIIDKLEFDSGLERYLSELESLYKADKNKCLKLFSGQAFIKIFSDNRRLLYNSGMFFKLKNIGLSVSLRSDDSYWGVEGEIGKVFYYYIVEDFRKAIKKAEFLLKENDDVKSDLILMSELYNVKGLSERKLVLFDDALESFYRCIDCVKSIADSGQDRDNSDLEFELSLAYLIISKINLHMLDFSASNKNGRQAVKILSRRIDEMADGDKKTSNVLFLAEDYRVCANSYIWQGEYELAEERLKLCEEIYKENNNSIDRYFIRFKYTSLLLKILKKDCDGAVEQLSEMLAQEAKSAYDKGTINYYIALAVYLNYREDKELLKYGFKCAEKGVEIFDSIDSFLEKAECNLLANLLSKLAGVRYLDDDDDNEYVEKWIEHVKTVLCVG